MSGASTSANPSTTQAKTDDSAQTPALPEKPPKQLEEDDEFEDFPVEDWNDDETDLAANGAGSTHLWEESWDDDDTSEDFAQMLKEEIKKVESGAGAGGDNNNNAKR